MSDKLVVGKTEDGLIFVAAPEERYEVITSCLTNQTAHALRFIPEEIEWLVCSLLRELGYDVQDLGELDLPERTEDVG